MKTKTNARLAIRLAVSYFTILAFCQGAQAQSETRFRLVNNAIIVVSLMANDQGPFDFVLDTGTNTTVVDPEIARRLSLTALDHITLITVAGKRSVPRSSFRHLTMGRASVEQVEVLVQDLAPMRKVDSHIAGIVGQNFLGHFNYLIDFKRHTIRVEQGDEIQAAIEGNRTSVEMKEGRMLVASELQSRTRTRLRLLLDSGANYLTLFHAASLGLSATPPPAANRVSNTGGEESGTNLGNVKLLIVGQQQFRNISAALIPPASDPQRAEDGSLPIAFFRSIYVNQDGHFVVFNPKIVANIIAGAGAAHMTAGVTR
jgi:predicted aspartyl protease